MTRWVVSILMSGLVLLPALGAQGTMVVPLNLQQLTEKAGRIVVGRCLSTTDVVDENGFPAHEITVAVEQTLKGPPTDHLAFKQFGPSPQRLREMQDSDLVPLRGLSTVSFAAGEEVVLFLYPESTLGFTSPVGLEQGKLTINTRSDGQRRVSNALRKDFRFFSRPGFSQGLRTIRTGSLPLEQLVESIQEALR